MKRYLKISSFILQGIYSAFCVLDIILCFIYHYNFNTSFGGECAHLALDISCILFFIPAMPIGILLNILAMPSKQSEQTERKRWIIWTIISPGIYLIFYLSAVCIFVAITGGV